MISVGAARLERAILWIAMLSLSALAITYLLFWAACLRDPYSIAFEGHVLWQSLMLSAGRNIYDVATLSHPPWSVTIYPPLFMLVSAPLLKICGVAFYPLRLVSIAACVLAAAGLYRLLRQCGCKHAQCITALALFLSLVPVFVFSAVARVDMLALSLSIWGLERFVACAVDPEGTGRCRRAFLWSTILMALAAFAKYQSAVFPLGIGWFLIWSGDGRSALRYLGVWLALTAFAAGLTQVVTGGFFEHMGYLSQVDWELRSLWINIQGLGPDLIKITVCLAIFLYGLIKAGPVQGIERLALCLVFASMLVLSYTMGIPASSSNHMLSVYLGMCIWAALMLKRIHAVFTVALALTALATVPDLAAMGAFMNRFEPTARAAAALLAAQPWKGKLVLTEDPYLAISTGATTAIVDPGTFMNAWSRRPEPMNELVSAIDAGAFAGVIVNEMDSKAGGGQVRWPGPVIRAIHARYALIGRTAGNCLIQEIYVPRRDRESE